MTATLVEPRTVGALDSRRGSTGVALRAPGRAPITYGQLRRKVDEIAAGLSALGVCSGDRVGILASTRPEWVLADFGALRAGAVVVPVYATNSPEECAHVLGHSESRVVFVRGRRAGREDRPVREELPALEHVIVLEGTAAGAITLAQLRERGQPIVPRVGGAARRRGDDRLHLGHDRPAQGLHAHPREPAQRRSTRRVTPSSSANRRR